ncbi:MAG TPA: hypothetical protein VIP05_04960 [Burkholderiaceae bacterium]
MNVLKALPVMLALAAAWSCANAAADFVVVQRGTSDLGDTAPTFLRSFTLPTNVNRSGTIANSAVLDLEVFGSEYAFNEVYINPPPDAVCTADGSGDPNQSASIGHLQPHGDDHLKNEWATNHIAFSSGLLNTNGTTNKVMICVRDIFGNLVSNLDNISVRSIVLHYHTTS